MNERDMAFTQETAIALHGELASCGITFVVLRYEGGGDSGNECYVALYTDAPAGALVASTDYPFEYSNGPANGMGTGRKLVQVGTTETSHAYTNGVFDVSTTVSWDEAFRPNMAPTNPPIDHEKLGTLAPRLFDGLWGLAIVEHDPDFNNAGSYGEIWWDLKRPHIMGTEHNVRHNSVDTTQLDNPLVIPGPADDGEANLEGAA